MLVQQKALARLQEPGLALGKLQLDEIAKRTALTAYRTRIAQDYLYADYRGIEGLTQERHAAALLLDHVYVKPRLQLERSTVDAAPDEHDLLKQLEDEDLSPSERIRLEEEFAALTGKRWGSRRPGDQPGSSVGDALANVRHAVILGGPGVGKSVLLRYLARTCALGVEETKERLGWHEAAVPILIQLAAFADARSREPALSLRVLIERRIAETGGDALVQAMDGELRTGNAIVLFDGVDRFLSKRHEWLSCEPWNNS